MADGPCGGLIRAQVGYLNLMLYTVLIVLAIIALAMFILGRR
jgi:hypothetical protein